RRPHAHRHRGRPAGSHPYAGDAMRSSIRCTAALLALGLTAVHAQEPAQETGVLMQRSGNSLLQATLAQRQVNVRTADVSFIAVPKPEPTVIQKHDLLTVIIREQSTFSSDGGTELSKSASINAAIQDYI